MSSQTNDFGAGPEPAIDELTQHEMALDQLIQGYMDKHDLSDGTTSLILLEMSVKMHMIGYALETEKPSASGLKLYLDRLRREIDNLIRDAKKNADHFIAEAKTVRAAAENESEAKLGDERGVR